MFLIHNHYIISNWNLEEIFCPFKQNFEIMKQYMYLYPPSLYSPIICIKIQETVLAGSWQIQKTTYLILYNFNTFFYQKTIKCIIDFRNWKPEKYRVQQVYPQKKNLKLQKKIKDWILLYIHLNLLHCKPFRTILLLKFLLMYMYYECFFINVLCKWLFTIS